MACLEETTSKVYSSVVCKLRVFDHGCSAKLKGDLCTKDAICKAKSHDIGAPCTGLNCLAFEWVLSGKGVPPLKGTFWMERSYL